MRITSLGLASVLSLTIGACAVSPPVIDAPPAAAPFAFDGARMSDHIRILGSDEFEGRAPNTPGETKTVAYLSDQFAKAGLQPGGVIVDGQRTWTQPVPLLKSEFAVTPVIGVTLGGKPVVLTQGEEIAVRAPTNGDQGINLTGKPLVFVGYGVKAPERGWDDYKGVDVRGKVIVMLVNDPDFEGGEGNFGGKAMTYYGRWTYKYEEGARQGAAGVLVVHETAPASYGWATVKNSNTNTMFDIVRKDPKAEHPPLEGWIQRDLAVKLAADSGLDFEVLKAAARKKDFRPVELKSRIDVHGDARTEVITSQNVVGILPGTTHPDETIIYSAHWDHLGVGLPDANGDRIYNGAIDNGTGLAHLIEQGRSFAAGPRPERSVVFMAVTAEEKGLLGSEYYAANPLYPLSTTVADLNMDALSPTGPAHDFGTSGDGKVSLQDDLIAALKARGRVFTPDPAPEAGHFFRSDHFPFAKRGVPAISIGSGEDLIVGGTAAGKAAGEAYVKDRYHQPADEWADDWDLTGMTDDIGLLYGLGRDLANATTWPEWQAGSEFKAVRDATAGERH